MPAAADILSDPDINQAYEDVRSDKSETTWLILKACFLRMPTRMTRNRYASATSDNLTLACTGTGDIAEMTESLADDEAAYAYVRMKLGNDEYSERVKFAFVVWQGVNTKVMRKAKMSFQSGQVKQVIRTYAVEIQTSDKKELEAEAVTLKLRKAMGANYDRQTTNY
ncbi:similar to coactosin-like protein [Plenodomus lingam JN3]|uniref:Similar to coactosin-like protein n=1 Tax=Leptosphaeria maculans (strain JN3 / isolate v23.1.3 / race Av1-4-5-6-7-8) TaxID=985895 RepID=E5AD59_LEPMJ|nr:similar to coactosin-like protein [Plenodomus lingam JN3]CBY02411.1 similar to coactosin-like protein [Plenodomus lingam JN3]